MFVREDKSYLTVVDKKAIEQGVAVLGIHSIRLDRYVSEERKSETAKMSAAELDARLRSAEWQAYCEQVTKKIATQNETVLTALEAAGLILGQYRNIPNQKYFDLWFWCNADKNGRRLDYLTLSPNWDLTPEQQGKIIEQAIAILEKVNTSDNCAIIQYEAIYDEQKLADIAEQFAEQNTGKFIRYGRDVGKIVKLNPELCGGYKYGFKKKKARTRGYRLTAKAVYGLSLENAEVG